MAKLSTFTFAKSEAMRLRFIGAHPIMSQLWCARNMSYAQSYFVNNWEKPAFRTAKYSRTPVFERNLILGYSPPHPYPPALATLPYPPGCAPMGIEPANPDNMTDMHDNQW
ncbi:hypothetical protein ACTXT7_002032 [Hymenolepis weldensis]